MSAINPKFTKTGRARTAADKPNYLKPQHWADPKNHFWNATQRCLSFDHHDPQKPRITEYTVPLYTEKSREYHNGMISKMLENIHNLTKIQNSQ